MKAQDILERLEDHKGRKLDLSNRGDKKRLFMAINRELEKRGKIISNISNCLKGQQTYDQTQYKTILDSNRRKD